MEKTNVHRPVKRRKRTRSLRALAFVVGQPLLFCLCLCLGGGDPSIQLRRECGLRPTSGG